MSATGTMATETTARATAFVAERRDHAEQLGRDLAEALGDPEAFAAALRTALASLADPDYVEGQRRVAPGIAAIHGVRWPLIAAINRGFRRETRHDAASSLLDAAERVLRERELEAHWFAFAILERTVVHAPERSWQLLRGAAARAGDWITVDSLAHAFGRGILAEPFRWAELEQLVYSPSRWERRLVGSTIATIPHVDRRLGRARIVVERGLDLVGQLIGDAEPDVRKALSWALRTLAQLDPAATIAFLANETETAARDGDGHRAWVIRDTLPRLSAPVAADLRARLDGIRARAAAPSTSRAAQTRAGFGGLGLELDLDPSRRAVVPRP